MFEACCETFISKLLLDNSPIGGKDVQTRKCGSLYGGGIQFFSGMMAPKIILLLVHPVTRGL